MAKIRSLLQVHFVPLILFVLILASDRTVLYRSVAYSILLLSIKMKYPSFLKKFSLLEKSCFKAKALKKFKISSDCHLKPSRFLKKVAILKIPSSYCFFSVSFKIKIPPQSVFLCQRKNQLTFCRKSCLILQCFFHTRGRISMPLLLESDFRSWNRNNLVIFFVRRLGEQRQSPNIFSIFST